MPVLITGGSLLLCLVVGVSDGDTLSARCRAAPDATPQTLRLRLAEIDAPEKAQAFGARSRAHLAALCFGREAQVRAQALDRYGRTVARVRCGGVDANAEQVRAGMAWVYERYARDPELRDDQELARGERRGLWQDAGPVPPWEWRRQRREVRG
ncbi:thermonuclease family protein [Rivibacter subsaxonicus]|uniref:Endonuclease YncB(Thermonuclease family) n=1 Tax=Rivibacter subsaxonicus TaxID=457575 RepID=A0A4Q7VDM7_9BURK|nr:thermonuclease family protein [Rivibacter subsaxonicus]RZT93860.1 endonuclease YncB(thermonuclease family) [Rivibacter subsaxonicus]